MTNKEKTWLEKQFDVRWTCPGCGVVSYSNKGYSMRQCKCNNMSPYMKKEFTDKGLKSLKGIQNA